MPDATEKWSSPPDWSSAVLERKGVSVYPVHGLAQYLVSGRLDQAFDAILPGSSAIGLWDVAAADPYAVRLSRDRVLVVSEKPLLLRAGWHPDGWALSPAGDASLVLDLEGPALSQLVSEATSALTGLPSPSASILFAGIRAVLYRVAPTRARLHVEAALAPYLWQWLGLR